MYPEHVQKHIFLNLLALLLCVWKRHVLCWLCTYNVTLCTACDIIICVLRVLCALLFLELSPLSSYHGSLVFRVLPVLRVLLLSENLVTLRTKEKNGKNRRTLITITQRTLEQERGEQENAENKRMLRTGECWEQESAENPENRRRTLHENQKTRRTKTIPGAQKTRTHISQHSTLSNIIHA